jgi:hypothetical protein
MVQKAGKVLKMRTTSTVAITFARLPHDRFADGEGGTRSRRRHDYMAALAYAMRPLDAVSLVAAFKQGRRIAPKTAAILSALARMRFAATADSGRTFALGRAS